MVRIDSTRSDEQGGSPICSVRAIIYAFGPRIAQKRGAVQAGGV